MAARSPEYVSARRRAASGSGIAFACAQCRAYTSAGISSDGAPSGICPASRPRSSSSDRPALMDYAEWYQLQYRQPLTSVTTIISLSLKPKLMAPRRIAAFRSGPLVIRNTTSRRKSTGPLYILRLNERTAPPEN